MSMQRVRRVTWVVWPAFLVAGVAEAVFFTVFDLHFFGAPLELSREAIYTLGFFGFWGMGIAASALTLFFEHPPGDANREDL